MADFAAPVACLAAFTVDGAAVGGSTIAGDVTKLSTSVAFHGLGLAVPGEVVGSAALVARSSTITAIPTTTHAATASVSATRGTAGAVAL